MGMDNIQVPPVGMRVPITPNAKAPSSVPRKKYKDGSEGGLTMNIQERIKALETEIAEKIKALKAEVQRRDEFPQFGDDYWYVDSDTEVMDTASYDGEYDQDRLSIGNVFKTKEQAQFAVEKLKVEAELRKFSKPFKCGEINQYIFLDTDRDRIDVENRYYFPTQGTTYFESEEKAQQALKSVGEERIKKYLFGAEG